MARVPPRPRTPLRRLSQGSLRALSRSGTFPDAPEGLGFLEPAMSELADEADALHSNIAGLHGLSNSLQAFNESFASFLYVMEMNSLTIDWPQAPNEASHQLAKKRAEDDARAVEAALRAAQEAAEAAEKAAAAQAEEALANDTTVVNTSSAPPPKRKAPAGILKNPSAPPKKKAKPKMTAKERRERSLAIEKVVTNLPLEYRGQDPSQRRMVESVIELMMDNPNGLEMLDFVKLPDLNQARANKCLLTMINRKIVSKDSSTGRILYYWHGVKE